LRYFALVGLAAAVVILAVAPFGLPDEPPTVPTMRIPPTGSPMTASPMTAPEAGAAAKAPATATMPSPADADKADSNPPPANSSRSAAAEANSVTEVKPEVFYVRDKENHLVPVPGFTYDDFVKYFRLKEQLDRPDAKPHYDLEQLTLVGTARSDRVEITATAKILLLGADWTKIPMRLNKAALREAAGYQGGGNEFLQFDPNGDGYVCWLRGSERTEHELTLKLTIPLATTAGENRLELSLPRAAASKLSLLVPARNVTATASSANLVPDVAKEGDGSRISLLGIGGDSWIAWRPPDQPVAQLSSALEATGAVFVKIDGRSVASEAALVVRSFGAEFDHFRIRLPRGAQLTGGQQPGYTLSPVADSGGSIVEVHLDRKSAGPTEVRLLTERAYDVTKSNEDLDLSGFAVLEAIPHRQSGHIVVAVAGDWQIVWGERTRVRQTDELPEALRRKDLVAGFEYFGQPNSLIARVVPRKTRVSVEPRYIYRVGPERTDLEARLKSSIRGARLFKLDVDLPGWELDTVAPDTAIDTNSLAIEPGGTIGMPLLSPAVSDLEVTIKAHRDHTSATKVIEWSLPAPHVDVLGPAEVTIIPAENVEISPQNDKLAGLIRSTGGPPAADASPSAIYYRSEQSKAKFVADFSVHSQSINVETESNISLHARQIEVAQSFIYQVRYEPLDRLILDVPRKLFDDRKLRFTIGDETVEAYEAAEQPSSERRSVRISLRQPSTGPMRLDVSFAVAAPDLSAASARSTDIPLIVPSDGRSHSNLAIITADSGIRIEQREGPWSVIEPMKSLPTDPASLQLTSAEPAEELRLALALDDRRAEQTMFVDRAWIQTWLTKSVRQDRAVYDITSDADSVRIKLPRGIQPRDVELALDGKSIAPTSDAAGRLVVNLGATPSRSEHLMAMRYQFEGQSAGTGWSSFELPTFEKQVKVRKTYWQLALPAGELLLGADGDLSPEYVWRWRDYGLGLERVPLKEEPQLDQWVALPAASQRKTSAAGTDTSWLADELPSQTIRYLFSTAGAHDRFEILAAPRWLLLLTASLTALVLGLAVIYVPALHSSRVLIVVAVILLVAVLIWPEPAVLLAQAASFGVCLAVFAFVLRRVFLWNEARDIPSSGRPSSVFERSSQPLSHRSIDDKKAATTTASIAIEVSADSSGESAHDAARPENGDAHRPMAEPAVGASGSSRKNQLT
jgi:hypothetical protein